MSLRVLQILPATAVLLVAGCAVPPAPAYQSVVPGTIGATLREGDSGFAVTALRPGGPAERAGLRVGDVLSHFNGVPLQSLRQFHWLVVETPPGSVVKLNVSSGGVTRAVEVPVEQLDLTPGA